MGLSPAPGIPTNSRPPAPRTLRTERPPTLPPAEGLIGPCTWQSIAEARASFERFLADASNTQPPLQDLKPLADELRKTLEKHLPPMARSPSSSNFQTSLATLSSLDCSASIAAVTARYALTGCPSGSSLSTEFLDGLTWMQDELLKLERCNTRQKLADLIGKLHEVLVRVQRTPNTGVNLAGRPEEQQREWHEINEAAAPLLLQGTKLVSQFDSGAMHIPVSRATQAIDLSARFLEAGQKKGTREKLSSLVSALKLLHDSLKDMKANPASKPKRAPPSVPKPSPGALADLRKRRRAFVEF